RPTRFRTPGDRLRTRGFDRRIEEPQAVPGLVPQSLRVPRRRDGRHRPAAAPGDAPPLAAYRWLLVPARRHSDRRVLAKQRSAGRIVAARPGRRTLPRPRLTPCE